MSDDTFTPPHGMGRKPDTPDRRDRILYRAVPNVDALPDEVNLEDQLPEVYDQGALGSCTGWSGAQVLRSIMAKDGHRAPFMPSPVFLYREARALEGTVGEDAGAEIRDIWKVAAKLGLPSIKNASVAPRYRPEDMPDPQSWAFRPESRWARQPPAGVYKAAELRQALTYFALPTTADLMKCLADGYLANIGIAIYRGFYGDQGPLYDVPDPNPRRERLIGWHAITLFGYSRPRRRWLIRNQWGDKAHLGAPTPDGTSPNFTLSFAYLEDPQMADSFWTGRLIEGGKAAKA